MEKVDSFANKLVTVVLSGALVSSRFKFRHNIVFNNVCGESGK